MEHLPFIVIDLIVFFILWLGFDINWIAAFIGSPIVTWAGFYIFYMLFPPVES